MASSPLVAVAAACALCLAAAPPALGSGSRLGSRSSDSDLAHRLYHPYRAERLDAVDAIAPAQVRLLPPGGPDAWPEDARSRLEARVRARWQPGRPLGAVDPGVSIWLLHPLVTVAAGDQVLLPVVDESSLPIRGALVGPPERGPRQVVVLIDASSSANASVRFRGPAGRGERISVLEAERRALGRLLDNLDRERVSVGAIAFGETVRGVRRPGARPEELRAALAADRAAHPAGEGRTDTICALWLAREWLDDAPRGTSREIVLLTDGDFPYSGRFPSCRRGSKSRREACRARRNRSQCPASHRFRHADGESDQVQMHVFARRNRHRLKVHSLVFETDRRARPYASLSETTGGQLIRVPSAGAMLAALPALVGTRVQSVVARNLTSGEITPELLEPRDPLDSTEGSFSGHLELLPGGNDVELRLLGPGGLAALYRFRVWFAPRYLQHYLAQLEERNRTLGTTLEQLVDRTRSETRARSRQRGLTIAPAALDPSLD
ncbi:MAG: VWA domain-containing protein [Myxococcota bacterium]